MPLLSVIKLTQWFVQETLIEGRNVIVPGIIRLRTHCDRLATEMVVYFTIS